MTARLRTLLRLSALGDRPDADLLHLFATSRDEAAFELLVRRHGPLVLGVCRRAVGPPAAEDAFQATFLLLARRAGTLREPGGVARWLYGTARRVASEARRRERRRLRRERRAAKPEAVHPLPDDTAAAVDAAVRRLPEPYRTAVLRCDLGGATREDAARELGVPAGTVASRLSRGRELLRADLTRRGVTLGLLAAAVPEGLAESTARVATLAAGATLTHGGRAMFGLKLAAVGLVLGGVGLVPRSGPADPPPAAKKEPTPAERLAAIQAEYAAEDKAGTHQGRDQRTGAEIDIHTTIRPDGYMPRLLELGRGADEATAAAALCWAVDRWQNPHPAESDAAFRLFVKRFAAGPLCRGYAKQVIAVASYGDGWDRVRQVLEVAADREARGLLELKQADMANPGRGGRWHAEVPANLALRRDTARALYERVAAEYPDLDGGKLAARARQEADKLRAAKP